MQHAVGRSRATVLPFNMHLFIQLLSTILYTTTTTRKDIIMLIVPSRVFIKYSGALFSEIYCFILPLISINEKNKT